MHCIERPKDKQDMEKFAILPQGIRYNTQQLMRDTRDHRRNQGYSALHTSRNNSKMLPKNIKGVAYEETQTAAALATSRTAAQKTSRFRDSEKTAEANFSQH